MTSQFTKFDTHAFLKNAEREGTPAKPVNPGPTLAALATLASPASQIEKSKVGLVDKAVENARNEGPPAKPANPAKADPTLAALATLAAAPPENENFWAGGGRLCDHCGCHGTRANRLWSWDWPGRPDRVWLHRQCEEAWSDSAPNSKNGKGQQ
jgi:hypothetical protein